MPSRSVTTGHSDGPLAETDAGRVRGIYRRRDGVSYKAFYGIPYAEAPVGRLTFEAPVPRARWAGIRPAREPGPTPLRQPAVGPALVPEPTYPGESILNVNVFAPAEDAASQLPVLVWFHGGGFVSGSSSSPWYEGGAFARDGVVMVSVSYRLGFVGFGLLEDAPANRAVLDWLLALDWVQRNIARFGGDPTRVTIAGQSAGAAAVTTILGLPQAQHLFASVFALSGAVMEDDESEAMDVTARLARRVGVAPTSEGFRSLSARRLHDVDSTLIEEVRRRPGHDALQDMVARPRVVGPVIDGTVLVRSTLDSLRAGVGAGKPVVLGATQDEFDPVVSPGILPPDSGAALRHLGMSPELVQKYVSEVDGGSEVVAGRYVSDRLVRAPLIRTARARGSSPTWLYRFAWPSPAWSGAIHCVDLPFFFDNAHDAAAVPLLGDSYPPRLATQYHGAAVALATQGSPGWRRWSEEEPGGHVFGSATAYECPVFASAGLLT
jgi:para-nitrobenzyl esterase